MSLQSPRQVLTYLLHRKENNTRIILQRFTDQQTIVYSPKKIYKINLKVKEKGKENVNKKPQL